MSDRIAELAKELCRELVAQDEASAGRFREFAANLTDEGWSGPVAEGAAAEVMAGHPAFREYHAKFAELNSLAREHGTRCLEKKQATIEGIRRIAEIVVDLVQRDAAIRDTHHRLMALMAEMAAAGEELKREYPPGDGAGGS